MRAWFVVAVVALGVAVPLRLEAQAGARGLGSPIPEGGERGAPPDETLELVPVAPTPPPTTYEQTDVPPPPGTQEGVRYPGTQTDRTRAMETDSGLRIPSGVATRLRALDSDFQVLAARGGGGSWVGGIVSILGGALALTLGIVNDLGAGSFGYSVSPYLYVYGGSGAVRGILELSLMTNPAGPAITFAHMPMSTMDEVQERLDFGEHELASLADRARLQRILDGSINIATGLAFVPVFATMNIDATNILLWVGVAGAAVSAISGLITLLTTSEAERRWSAYEELRNRLAARGEVETAAQAPDPEQDDDDETLGRRIDGPRLAPVAGGGPQGGAVGVQGQF